MLKATGSEDPKYPHPFELKVKVQLGNNSLTQELAVTNTGQPTLCMPAEAAEGVVQLVHLAAESCIDALEHKP